ncbi:MAG TPA: hypothetical protein VIH87_02305 [Methylocella sp.]
MDFEKEIKILHWLPQEDRWETISWDAWSAFRGILAPSIGLLGLSGGIHHFAVVVFDGTEPVNIIPHKYLIEPDGSVGRDNFGGLTKEEREDERRFMTARELTPNDTARLNQIREKLGKVYELPRESIAALKWTLPVRPQAGSAAERFLSQYR